LSQDHKIESSKELEGEYSYHDATLEAEPVKADHASKILVVDDEQDIAFTLRTILTEAGFSVDAFTDPSIAFDLFRPGKYDLIVLDIRMPGLNGFELYVKLMEQESSIKVLFLTAVNEFSMFAKFKSKVSPMSGKRYYLQKPVDVTKLLQRVNDMLKRS
jgi:two-component system copper resistance phosphate regulon response regulator CusR